MLSYLLLGILSLSTGTASQQTALRVSICELVNRPSFYNARMVRVRGRSIPGPAGTLFDKCTGPYPHSVVLVFPDDGPVRPPVQFRLKHNRDLERFLYYWNAKSKVKNPKGAVAAAFANLKYCLVTVTVTGRFDAVSKEDASWGRGYGEGGRELYRIVVESVSDPVAKECPESSPSSK